MSVFVLHLRTNGFGPGNFNLWEASTDRFWSHGHTEQVEGQVAGVAPPGLVSA